MLSEVYCSREAPTWGQIPASSGNAAFFAGVADSGTNRKVFLGWKRVTHLSSWEWNLAQDTSMTFPASDVAEQYTLVQPLKRKETDSIRCWGKSARTGRESQQKSKYSARLQHSMAQAFPKLKVISLCPLAFNGFFFHKFRNLGLGNGRSS